MTRTIHKANISPLLLVAMLAALPATFSGCATTSEPESRIDSSIVFVDRRELGKKIEVDSLRSAVTETGTRKVWTTIHNKTKKPLALEVRAVYRGDQGEPVEPEAAWTQVFVQPRSSVAYDGYSMSRNAKQAILEIRVGNR